MKQKFIYNNKLLKQRRGDLRKNQTEAEEILRHYLRNRQIAGFKFFRQYSVGMYILDFYCPQVRLAVELDGSQHVDKDNRDYDNVRDLYLNGLNIRVLRFWNDDVLKNINNVLEIIKKFPS